jgi:hypothetical protein
MGRPPLEAQLAALTQEFVTRLVEAIRNASFADVAGLKAPKVGNATHIGRTAPSAKRPTHDPDNHKDGRRARQSAAARAELGERLVQTLKGARQPLGVRALSSALGVAPDLLTTPLRELRSTGRVQKHGEKRATTYSTE